ncbi:hypothetical protein OSB04_004672 [Centaurea solstitialis]|uniref:non-specific serine/threonine protein kinase n=1 Tax=Centaurea solstitialis TaxID=347529 RepID=A0AA38TXJ9_9ASTR|nr:hypothetical protein OSB04_004672 [Centaurea solstitialis]
MDNPATDSGTGNRHVIFGKYEMGRLLGQGMFAKVYYARDLATAEGVAVKVIKTEQVRKEGLMEQITREISIMRLVRHGNVVELKEVLATKTKIYLVMEYVRGGELFAKVARGKLKEDSARRYFQQLIGAVEYCHSRGVSHRDLKPENLLLDENGDLKVSDFGLSALPEQLRHDGMLHTQCGTPAYVAPEVLRKKGYDGAAADLWSCGVILYVLLAGSTAANLEAPERRPVEEDLNPPIRRVPWFSKGIETSIPDIHEPEPAPGSEKFSYKRSKSAPAPAPFYNAFEFISSMSTGFDLSGMFEADRHPGSLFTSRFGAPEIVRKLESVAKELDLEVSFSDKNGCKVKMEGGNGRLSVAAEVFEVAPEVAVVELSKAAGDTLEYNKLCEEYIKPGLQDIVWSWQGEDNNRY